MCGIVGYFSVEKTGMELTLLERLVYQSKIRGLHAFGISFWENGKMNTFKTGKLAPDMIVPFIASQAYSMIFHARYSTSGDYADPNNNQPIVCKSSAIAMNGVISMRKKEQFEADFNVQCETYNDTEIMLRKKEQNFKLEFIILIGNKQGFIQIYDNYDSRIFGDIEADIFEGEFIVLLKEKKFKEKLDNFCKLNISKLNRVIIDHEEEAMRDMRQTFD